VPDAASSTSAPRPAARGGWRQRLGHAIYVGSGRIKAAEPEINGLAQIVKPGDTVLDIGAALGMYTVPLAYLTGPRGRVDSFDPQPRNFHVLRFLRAITGASKGRLRRIALGPEAGAAELVVPIYFLLPIFGHGHISQGSNDGDRRMHRIATEVDTVDAWVAREQLAKVSFIKIDVEGFEPSVIAGAGETIDRDRPSLLMEIEDRHLVRYGRTAAGFLAEIAKRWPEYKIYTWSGTAWQQVDHVEPQVRNYLFATDAALSR
jgi:FkbM family methyltransferase